VPTSPHGPRGHQQRASRDTGSHPPASRVDQARARATNLALVARTVFAADPPPTRADVAAATSMTRSTVSRLVDDLVDGAVVAELEPVAKVGPGRPGTPLVPHAGAFAALGLQVNVGYLAVVVVDLAGGIRTRRLVTDDLRGSGPAVVLERLATEAAAAVADLPPGLEIVGAGLALPGIVTTATGMLLRAPNLGWSDVDVPSLFDTARIGVPVSVGNEADLASRTVSLVSPGHPGALRDFIYVSGETGIGGAVVIDGLPLPGRHGWAGEIGHVTVDPSGPACSCGSTGCLEQYAGKRALLTAAGLDADASTTALAERVRSGDDRATRAVDRAAWALGWAVGGAINIVDVPVVVLGGHLREIASLLRPRLEATLRERVISAGWVPPTIETAGADPTPGAVGAAYRELERVIADPARWIDARPGTSG
jgi:predicted NBD/HSP70 family sugar kinase